MATEPQTPEERARARAKYLSDVIWHAGAYVIINAFLWALDIIAGGGIQWAYWVTLGWGIGLAFHVLAYIVDGRQLEDRKTAEYLREEHDRPVVH